MKRVGCAGILVLPHGLGAPDIKIWSEVASKYLKSLNGN
ncbi:unknow [Vibrio campbellii]|nr:unknow [Vibrio campbellii]